MPNHKICKYCPKLEGCNISMIGDLQTVNGEEVKELCEVSIILTANLLR